MAKDPAFLFYDGDAAKDVSHMNRLERGCYFDLLQAQRKFGGYTVEQARKILGKDFDECWPAIEMILTKGDDGKYFIEWVAESTKKRKQYADKQAKRIKEYWDKKKENESFRGITEAIPLVNENEIVNKNGSRLEEIGSAKVKEIANDVWKDQGWKEQMCMGLSCTMEELQKWLALFNSSISGDTVPGFNKSSYKKMSRGWIVQQKEKGTKVETGIQKTSTAPPLTRMSL